MCKIVYFCGTMNSRKLRNQCNYETEFQVYANNHGQVFWLNSRYNGKSHFERRDEKAKRELRKNSIDETVDTEL